MRTPREACHLQARMWLCRQPSLLAPQTWTSSLQNCKKLCKGPSVVAPGWSETPTVSRAPLQIQSPETAPQTPAWLPSAGQGLTSAERLPEKPHLPINPLGPLGKPRAPNWTDQRAAEKTTVAARQQGVARSPALRWRPRWVWQDLL